MKGAARSCAALHARCFTSPRPWTEAEFAVFLENPNAVFCDKPGGFALGRVVLDEAELLTIAIAPEHRRKGRARSVLTGFLSLATARGASMCFLEVAASNCAALGLYHGAGFRESGRRRGYYVQADGPPVDAILLSRRLTPA